MSTNLAVSLVPETLRTLAFGSISGTYAGIGTALSNPSRIFYLQNNTDVIITFSFDGVNDHLVLAPSAFILIDVTTNRTDSGGSLNIAQGRRIYAKGAPSSGSVNLTSFYGSNGN